jgi:hypothetical protein
LSAGETCEGYHAAFFDVTTTATSSGPVVVCGHYSDDNPIDGIVDGTGVDENKLRILHKATGSSDFVDVTTSRDTVANVICGEVDSLSPFVIAGVFPCNNAYGDFAARSKLVVRKINTDVTPGNDGLLVKGEFTLPSTTSFSALDPATNGARVILSDAAGDAKVTIDVSAGADAGKGTAGWKASAKADKWTFTDRNGKGSNSDPRRHEAGRDAIIDPSRELAGRALHVVVNRQEPLPSSDFLRRNGRQGARALMADSRPTTSSGTPPTHLPARRSCAGSRVPPR